MINANELQSLYNDLYVELRKYIWAIDTVSIIVDLETATYKQFPDLKEVKDQLHRLHGAIRQVLSDDEDLKKALEYFEEAVDDTDESMYANLKSFREVNPL